MATMIFTALINANENIQSKEKKKIEAGKIQLNEIIQLLEKGFGLGAEIEPIIEMHKSLDKVPEQKNNPFRVVKE
jgi:hypothetical protein